MLLFYHLRYFWSEASDKIMIPVSGKQYIYEIAAKKLEYLEIEEAVKKLLEAEGAGKETATAKENPKKQAEKAFYAYDARLSPKANFVSFVYENNVFVYEIASKKCTRLTKDGGGAISNGVAEFVAQEEMDRFRG
jgi:dipeptidyl-peptidase 4